MFLSKAHVHVQMHTSELIYTLRQTQASAHAHMPCHFWLNSEHG